MALEKELSTYQQNLGEWIALNVIPNAVSARGLVDTGASCTAIRR